MIPVISVLLVLTLSVIVIRVATVALIHTGMGREAARFQARSAFTGAGYTTSEAEDIVNHPLRRRLVSWLMVAGNVGIVTAMSSLLLSFVDMRAGDSAWISLSVLIVGLLALVALSSSAWVDSHLCRFISWTLKRFTQLDARDYARLLHLREDYGVSELRVQPGEWLAARTLAEAGLSNEGILVLGIECPGGQFIGAPAQGTEIRESDRLLLYGRTPRIAEIDRRRPVKEGADHDLAGWPPGRRARPGGRDSSPQSVEARSNDSKHLARIPAHWSRYRGGTSGHQDGLATDWG